MALPALNAPGLNPEDEIDDWRDGAACRDTDPDLFFPVGTTGPALEQIAAAKAKLASALKSASELNVPAEADSVAKAAATKVADGAKAALAALDKLPADPAQAKAALNVFVEASGKNSDIAKKLPGWFWSDTVYGALVTRVSQAMAGELSLDETFQRIDADIAAKVKDATP